MSEFPDYDRPPVVEVAMGVQFAELKALCVPHVGLYWETIREEFPRYEDKAPLPHWADQPEQATMLDKPPLLRTWFRSEEKDKLIQVQRDKFLYNWVGYINQDEYPRYGTVKREFTRHWDGFRDFLRNSGLNSPEVGRCELTYVNHVKQGDGWESIGDVGQLFTAFTWASRGGILPEPDAARWFLRFPLPQAQGTLQVTMTPAVEQGTPAGEPLLQVNLTARGGPTGEANDDTVGGWFDLAHEWIVKGFADLVTEKADSLWGKH